MQQRCDWSKANELMIKYHDYEWGVPVHDDDKLFEFLVLDAFQAGLSWATILNKRENFRNCFDNFNPEKIVSYNSKKILTLMQNTGIIRNKLKIESTINNAAQFIKIQEQYGSFNNYIWQFTDGITIINSWKTWKETPTHTIQSDTLSKDLVSRGFKFVGSTICYAFMQAIGMVNDHIVTCFRYKELQ